MSPSSVAKHNAHVLDYFRLESRQLYSWLQYLCLKPEYGGIAGDTKAKRAEVYDLICKGEAKYHAEILL